VKDDSAYLKHLIDAANQIEEYIKGKSYQDYLAARMMQDAIIRQIEIIGEATKMISKETKEKNKKIPWKDMAGMRDKLIHGYFGVDLVAVWDTAQKDIPILKEQISKIKLSN
jgi:uncharacterized protein with HEPN domain